jgi:uncharacterized protein (UPF0335 family)
MDNEVAMVMAQLRKLKERIERLEEAVATLVREQSKPRR